MTFERTDGIWISDIHGDRIPQLCARCWDSFLSHCCSSIIYMYIRAVSSYSLWYLVSEVKVNLFLIWICWNIQIFIHKWESIESVEIVWRNRESRWAATYWVWLEGVEGGSSGNRCEADRGRLIPEWPHCMHGYKRLHCLLELPISIPWRSQADLWSTFSLCNWR